jgi:hypothetical protein
VPDTPMLYFGPTASYAICPHNVDNLNLAIQINPITATAVGNISVYVYMSNVCSVQVPAATVNLYCGLASTDPSTWTTLLTTWNPSNFGTTPVAEIPNPKVLNCCWMGSYVWNTADPKYSKIHLRKYGLLATLNCDSTNEQPGCTSVLSQDPCAAVFNSLLL